MLYFNQLTTISFLFEFTIFLISDRLAPFVRGVFAGDFDGEVAKPAVGGGAVPVFYFGGDVDAVAGMHFNRVFAPFLVVAAAGYADEYLTATGFGVVDVPVVATGGFEGDVEDADLTGGYRGEVTLADEVFGEGVVWLSDGEHHGCFVFCFGIDGGISGFVYIPDFFGEVKYGPAFWPSGIEGYVGDDGSDFFLGYAVVFGIFQVEFEGGISDAGSHQGYYGDDASGLYVDILIVPVFSK